MATKSFRTSDLARAVGIHPNTVRRYVEWGLVPPVERSPAGYRLFTQRHLDCLRLARLIYAPEYPGLALRAASNEIIQCAVMDDWAGALQKAQAYLAAIKAELVAANQAADLLENWARRRTAPSNDAPLPIHQVSRLVGASQDAIRNWERNGLIRVPRNTYNNYRLFGKKEIERLSIIRMLTRAGYSHMAILRMFLELDAGKTRHLKKALDTPRADEDVFYASDRWLSTLQAQEHLALKLIHQIEQKIASGELVL